MSTVYKFFHIHFKTPENKDILSNLQIGVFDTITGAEATIYSDEGVTAMTNVITNTVFDALGDGVVSFWSSLSSFDLHVLDVTSQKAVYFRGVTLSDKHVVFDSKMNGLDAVVAISSVQYSIPSIATGLTAETMSMATTSFDDIDKAICTILIGDTVTTAVIGDLATTVGDVTVAVNKTASTINCELAEADHTINGLTDANIQLYPDGWFALLTFAADTAIIIAGQGYKLEAAV